MGDRDLAGDQQAHPKAGVASRADALLPSSYRLLAEFAQHMRGDPGPGVGDPDLGERADLADADTDRPVLGVPGRVPDRSEQHHAAGVCSKGSTMFVRSLRVSTRTSGPSSSTTGALRSRGT